MESSAPQSSTFTLRSLFVLVAIICLGLAICFPWVGRAREQARRQLCKNNLKQIGLGVRHYHDIRQEIVPSYLTDDHSPTAAPHGFVTWPILILPFYSGSNDYQYVDLGTPLDATAAPPADHAFARNMSFAWHFCPTRRTPPASTRDGAGSVGDYACVSRADLVSTVVSSEPRTWDAAMLVCRVFNTNTVANTVSLGDFKPGTLGRHDYRSMTTFADITDGLSYTAFIGEKAVHADRSGGHPAGPSKTQLGSEQDGTYYFGSGGNLANLEAPGAIAYWSRRLAPVDSQESVLPNQPRSEDPNNRFGGWHGGLTLFLMGDGSVRGIDHQIDNLVLQRLGCRNDGDERPLPPDAAAEH